MKKVLLIAAVVILASTVAYAQQEQVTQVTTTKTAPSGFDKRLKIEGYVEYINFTGGDIGKSTWGGGVLGRYLFLDWLGVQTNISFYSNVKTKELGDDLAFYNWRLSLLLHSYIPDVDSKLYGYAGGGLGVQFNDDVGSVKIKDPLTGHVLAGIGYDITDIFSIEGEVGYQFGKADADNYKDDEIGVEALFVRLGAGIRF